MSTENEAKWYVVHTRTGYENKVAADLKKTVDNRNMKDLIQEIMIPTEEVVELNDDGKRKVSQRKIYPCYLMVKMILTSETWYVVRNATGVTGFVGPGSDPVPLTDEEVEAMGVDVKPPVYETGETVRMVSGPLEDLIGTIGEVDEENHRVKVLVKMFGKDTVADLDFIQVRKL